MSVGRSEPLLPFVEESSYLWIHRGFALCRFGRLEVRSLSSGCKIERGDRVTFAHPCSLIFTTARTSLHIWSAVLVIP